MTLPPETQSGFCVDGEDMDATGVSGSGDASTGTRAGTLAVLATAQLVLSLDYSIVNVALPSIGHSLRFSGDAVEWVVTAYAIMFGGFLLLGGRSADLLGRRRMFMIAAAAFGIASTLAGLSSSTAMLLTGRALQGLAGAFLFPATLSLVTTSFPEGPARNRAISVWGATGAGGLAAGVFVGGVLTTFLGWRWVFFVNVPVLAAVIAGGALVLPRARPSRPSVRRFDVPGAVAVSAGAMLVVLAFAQAPASGWADPATWLPAGVGLTLLGAFLWIEHRSTSPLMPLALLRRGTLYGAMIVAAAFMASLGLQFFFLTMYLQSALHQTALAAGVSVLPLAGAIFAGNEVGGRLATRFGARPVLPFGLAMGGFGLLMYAFLGASGYVPVLVAGEIIAGLGQGVAFSTVYIIAASGVESGRQGVASAMTSTAQFLGGSIGLALLVDVLTSRLPGSSAGTPTLDGGSIPGLLSALHWAFAAQAVIALAGTLVAALVIGRARIEHSNEGTVAVAA